MITRISSLILMGALLVFLFACTAQQTRGPLTDLQFQQSKLGITAAASGLCDIPNTQKDVNSILASLRMSVDVLAEQKDVNAAAALLQAEAELTLGQAYAVLDGMALLKTFIPANATLDQGIEILGAGIGRCILVLEAKLSLIVIPEE